VNLDTLKSIEIGLDKLCIMLKKPELKLTKCIDDAFVVPDAEAKLVGKSSLELAECWYLLMHTKFICKHTNKILI
jgi:hypothetical protein